MTTSTEIHAELLHLQQLANQLDYPASLMLNATGEIPGPGFFPGAWGSMVPATAISSRPIMVLGQDQDNMSGLAQSLKKGYETDSSTWRNLLQLFTDAGIDPADCFLTNYIMGVRRESARNTGPSPALAYPDFMRACSGLFLEQLRIQRPRVIITMGMVPFQLLSLVSSSLRYRALGIMDFSELDTRRMHINEHVVFDDDRRTTATVVPICHPSYPQNGKGRSFSASDRFEGEAAMLKYVLEQYVQSSDTSTVVTPIIDHPC